MAKITTEATAHMSVIKINHGVVRLIHASAKGSNPLNKDHESNAMQGVVTTCNHSGERVRERLEIIHS